MRISTSPIVTTSDTVLGGEQADYHRSREASSRYPVKNGNDHVDLGFGANFAGMAHFWC